MYKIKINTVILELNSQIDFSERKKRKKNIECLFCQIWKKLTLVTVHFNTSDLELLLVMVFIYLTLYIHLFLYSEINTFLSHFFKTWATNHDCNHFLSICGDFLQEYNRNNNTRKNTCLPIFKCLNCSLNAYVA